MKPLSDHMHRMRRDDSLWPNAQKHVSPQVRTTLWWEIINHVDISTIKHEIWLHLFQQEII